MSHLSIIIFCLFIFPIFVVIGSSYRFTRFLRSPAQEPLLEDADLPPVAVIMSVRGLDPSLKGCVHSLLNQDYPAPYALKIVVDSQEDPAWDALDQLLKQYSTRPSGHTVELLPLKTRYTTCGLKCSALIQAVSQLNPEIEAVAFVDSDVVTQTHWLRSLISPLNNPKVGLTSGLPWYIPDPNSFGSRVRHLWNIYCLTGRFICKTPSGASMAIRRELLTLDKVLGIWKNVLSEDVTAATATLDEGLEIRFVPSLIMVNRESCSLAGCWNFVKRQFFWTRLYSDNWNFIAAQAFFRTGALLSATMLLPVALWSNDIPATLWLSGGLITYFGAIGICILLIQNGINQKLLENGEKIRRTSPLEWPRILSSFIVAHLLVLAGTLASFGVKSIEWRGIRYQITENSEVRMLNYSPYQTTKSVSNVSIL